MMFFFAACFLIGDLNVGRWTHVASSFNSLIVRCSDKNLKLKLLVKKLGLRTEFITEVIDWNDACDLPRKPQMMFRWIQILMGVSWLNMLAVAER